MQPTLKYFSSGPHSDCSVYVVLSIGHVRDHNLHLLFCTRHKYTTTIRPTDMTQEVDTDTKMRQVFEECIRMRKNDTIRHTVSQRSAIY